MSFKLSRTQVERIRRYSCWVLAFSKLFLLLIKNNHLNILDLYHYASPKLISSSDVPVCSI